MAELSQTVVERILKVIDDRENGTIKVHYADSNRLLMTDVFYAASEKVMVRGFPHFVSICAVTGRECGMRLPSCTTCHIGAIAFENEAVRKKLIKP
jgi:hypothetical protein